jgi:hypothetical protein
MRIRKNDIPTLIDSFGTIVRQKIDFGDATGYGMIGTEHFLMAQGTDIESLLQGLQDNLCHSPHWGYMIAGDLTIKYKDGVEENVQSGDLFYWPPGHTVKANMNAEFILFSPQKEHTLVLDHIIKRMGSEDADG